METEPVTPNALLRFTTEAKDRAQALFNRATRAMSQKLRTLRARPAKDSPPAFERLAPRRSSINYGGMGDSDLQAVLERRAIVARELAALEAARHDMVAEDQELMVAERVLRRLAGSEMVEARSEPAKLAFIGDRANSNDKD